MAACAVPVLLHELISFLDSKSDAEPSLSAPPRSRPFLHSPLPLPPTPAAMPSVVSGMRPRAYSLRACQGTATYSRWRFLQQRRSGDPHPQSQPNALWPLATADGEGRRALFLSSALCVDAEFL